MTTVTEIREALQCARASCSCARGRNVHCPVTSNHGHGDSDPSLTMDIKGDRILWDCKRGCDPDDVIEALRDRNLWPPEQDLTPRNQPRQRKPTHFTTEWAYRTPAGEPIAWHGRFDYDDGSGKEFLWRLPEQQWGTRGIGLGELSISELPLYNRELLEDDPTETVYVCEGEKAADACVEHGLIAVALGGGAAQKEFGETLEPLLKRDVVLWPDNDEAGASFMGRIAAALPRAKFLSPPSMPAKGDAFDFFAAGRTIAEIRELTKSPEPVLRVTDDGVEVEVPVPNGAVRFEFTNINAHDDTIDAVVTTYPLFSPVRTTEPFQGHVNARSLSNREAYRRGLDSMYGKDGDWTRLLNTGCRLFSSAYVNQVQAVDIAEIALNYELLYRVENFAPEKQLTIVFGQGGSGKTELSLDLAAHLLIGAPWLGRNVLQSHGILFVDYEADGSTIRRRLQRIFQGMGAVLPVGSFHYFEAKGIPYAQQAQRIRREALRVGADVIIVDSAAAACGGEPEKAENALNMLNAVKAIGLTTILIAHIAKSTKDNAASSRYMPFGSVFWHNNARATWFVDVQNTTGANEIHVALLNRKMNDDRKQPDIGARIVFDGKTGPVRVQREQVVEGLQSKKDTLPDWIEGVMKANFPVRLSVADIVELLGFEEHPTTEATVRKELNKHEGTRFVREGTPSHATWAMRSERNPDDAPPPYQQGEFGE